MGCGASAASVQSRHLSGVAQPSKPPVNRNDINRMTWDNSITSDEVKPTVQDNFCRVMDRAVHELHMRQRGGPTALDADETEAVLLLSRELDNMRAMLKSKNVTALGAWQLVEKQDEMDRFAQEIYKEILSKSPKTMALFYSVEMSEQAKQLGRMLATAIHVFDKPDVAQQIFTSVGARHRAYGVTMEHYKLMRDAFFEVFPRFVSKSVFEGSREEWVVFWSKLLESVERGSESARGEKYGKIRQDETVKRIQEEFGLISERQKGLDPPKRFVGVMYAKAIELNSSLAVFDALRDIRSSRRVFQSITDVINGLGDMEKMKEYLLELGARHVAYNVTAKHMKMFTEPFIYTCRHFLEDEWNMAMESRFLWVWEFMLKWLSSGMEGNVKSMENTRAPNGVEPFCLLIVDIEGSTQLWARDSHLMRLAVKNYHRIVRFIIALYNAYEVKTVGDSFMIACRDVYVGLQIALSVQMELMRASPITPGFKMLEQTEGGGDPSCWRNDTIRVRVALQHCTDAVAVYDTVYQRYDYYGPSVNCCSHIKGVGCGGQILMSKESLDVLRALPAFHDDPCPIDLRQIKIDTTLEDSRGLDEFITVTDVGPRVLKDLAQPVHLVSITPSA
ncbi:Adenylyl cyclase class-3/4/guanylyl cyclase [Trypanosoma melophagium]|uniref:Adenylyl cyclase class-3/4/guanylyl cyclase n=1 Tax=Trypanosoma melophagium TaxID=715481 RepID=UPI00351A192F|nr:Adenylyl cyclase class-3/4/guanylyl cyclase [Trypanosoma melophagium]